MMNPKDILPCAYLDLLRENADLQAEIAVLKAALAVACAPVSGVTLPGPRLSNDHNH